MLPLTAHAGGEAENLTHQAYDALIESDSSVTVIDVRRAEEYAEGHVPGAINIPHETILNDTSVLDSYRDGPMVFYCKSGRRAGMVTSALADSGDKPIYHLEGDMKGWVAAGRATE